MNKKNDSTNIDGVTPPKKSIRNISLPKREEVFEENTADRPTQRVPRRTKHLSIDKQDESTTATEPVQATGAPDYTQVELSEPVPTPAPRPRGRKNWNEHVEEAFLSSEDIVIEKKSAANSARNQNRKVIDSDDYGNTSSESHFEPLQTELKRSRQRKGGALLFIIIALILIFGLMHTVFARVSITLPTDKISISLSDEQLPVEIPSTVVTENGEKKVTIDGVKTVSVSRKATGTVILYNNYSTEPYELIATTRVQTANGSVYKLLEGVKIPGKKGSTPGSINAKVEADLPGSEYNARGGLDLKLPGLIPGTQKYQQIYAKTAANFTGGSKGAAADLSGLDTAINAVKNSTATEVLEKVKAQNPDLVFLTDSVNIVSGYDSTKIPAAPAGGGDIEVPVRLTTKIIGLKREDLKREMEAYLSLKKGHPVSISGEVLDFLQYKVVETPEESLAAGKYSVKVSGAVEGSFDDALQSALKNQLAGKSMTEAIEIINTTFPNEGVTVKAWPFWKDVVPTNPSKIKIKIKN